MWRLRRIGLSSLDWVSYRNKSILPPSYFALGRIASTTAKLDITPLPSPKPLQIDSSGGFVDGFILHGA